MKNYHCDIHNLDIMVYDKNEENLFIDDNRKEIAIFYYEDGTKYLKRFIMGQCDNSCETIKQILMEE